MCHDDLNPMMHAWKASQLLTNGDPALSDQQYTGSPPALHWSSHWYRSRHEWCFLPHPTVMSVIMSSHRLTISIPAWSAAVTRRRWSQQFSLSALALYTDCNYPTKNCVIFNFFHVRHCLLRKLTRRRSEGVLTIMLPIYFCPKK